MIKITSTSLGGFGTRTRPEASANETAVNRAKMAGLLSLIRENVADGDVITPLSVSSD